ncbi:hypothetical protein SNARM312S_03942 [Streptomyces narbonensis]
MFSQVANSAAAALCFESVVTAVEEPPQLPVAFSPLFHCGRGAMAHLPLVSGAAVVRVPGAQTALTQASCSPVFRALFQAGVYIGWLSTAPSATRPPQKSETFLVAASSMPTFQVSPSKVHHLAPACWERPAKRPESLAEKVVRDFLGAFFLTARAVSANSSQVVGTVRPYCLKRSSR